MFLVYSERVSWAMDEKQGVVYKSENLPKVEDDVFDNAEQNKESM